MKPAPPVTTSIGEKPLLLFKIEMTEQFLCQRHEARAYLRKRRIIICWSSGTFGNTRSFPAHLKNFLL